MGVRQGQRIFMGCALVSLLSGMLVGGHVLAEAPEAADAQPLSAMPTGYAIADLGDLSEEGKTARARTALIRGALYGGDQPGLAQMPSVMFFAALSVFMGGSDAPKDLARPVDELR